MKVTRPLSTALLVAWLGSGALVALAVGCAESPVSSAARSPAASPVEAGAPPPPAPSPDMPSLKPSSTSAVTVEDAASDLAKAEKELSEALDPTKAIPLGTDRCSVVCKALASMRSAAGRLCELTTDDRCTDAKAHLTKAEARAKEACPVCAAP